METGTARSRVESDLTVIDTGPDGQDRSTLFARPRGAGRGRPLLAFATVLGVCAMLVAAAPGALHTQRLSPSLCRTVGGGKFVPIPGFPGERIDRRLLPDVRWLVRKYGLFITDGFSRDPVHSASGEHPLGLALDIVPNVAAGGNWRSVTSLALWAEPRQSAPRAPFRWVGYNGDAGHGRGHHLHLSWNHSPNTTFGKPVRVVYTRICPQPIGDGGGGSGGDGGGTADGDQSGGGGGGNQDGGGNGGGGGGNAPNGGSSGGGAGDTGGNEPGRPEPDPPEDGGVDADGPGGSGGGIKPT